MRQIWLHVGVLLGLALGLVMAPPVPAQEKAEDGKNAHAKGAHQDGHGPKFTKYAALINHEKKEFDLKKPEDRKTLIEYLKDRH